ncbi:MULTISPECIES: DMT family transporter [unclassified Novosphingobium]|uniref:DMT family transporter n=1 Tax=unclassified Novosphingobium TaxID=2644732 RepID=UPI000A7A2709|nr:MULTISPECIES: DMT family transporter [unclassified Novosphingobium]MDR6707032.1 drug/metabolite transporter (DMT)-like permease [Novosphingobium sp. 1748]
MPQHQRPFLALGLRLAATLALATLYMMVKLLHQRGVALPEIMFWRQALTIPLLGGWLAARGRLFSLYTRRLKTHALRTITGSIGMVCLFGAQVLLPLPVATVLGFTTPLFAVLLTAVVYKSPPGRLRWMAVALGFAGVIIITAPGDGASIAGGISPLGLAAGLCSGFLVAVISLQIRDLTSTETPIAVVFYFALFGTLLLTPTMLYYMTPHSPALWAEIIAMGVVGALAQVLLTAALRFGSAASVLVMDYATLIWTTIYGWTIFDQLPPAHTWAGAPLIVAAGMMIALREHRRIKATRETA